MGWMPHTEVREGSAGPPGGLGGVKRPIRNSRRSLEPSRWPGRNWEALSVGREWSGGTTGGPGRVRSPSHWARWGH